MHAEFGVNSRLDELQAAILRARLRLLPAWTVRRRELAAAYRPALMGACITVPPESDPGHVYHLFPALTGRRDAFQAHLAAEGIGTLVHYPFAITTQAAVASTKPAHCPIAERVASEVVSLPLHPALTNADLEFVAAAVQRWRP